MSDKNGHFNDINDIALEDRNTNGHRSASPTHVQQAGVSANGSGPWVNSTADYTRTTDDNGVKAAKRKLPSRRRLLLYGVVCVAVFAVGLGLGVVIGRFTVKSKPGGDTTTLSPHNIRMTSTAEPLVSPCTCPTPPEPVTTPPPLTCQKCPRRNPVDAIGEENSPFAPLTEYEMGYALKVLTLNGYISNRRSFSSDRAAYMYNMINGKHKVLDYLDNNGTFPGRYAKVFVYRGDKNDVMEYRVGPLDRDATEVEIQALRLDGEVHFNSRPVDYLEYQEILQYVAPHFNAMNILFMNSFDQATFPDRLSLNSALIPTLDIDDRRSIVYLYLRLGGYLTVRILPVTCIVHHPGTDTRKWFVSDFYYASQGPFNSGSELQDAYLAGSLRNFTLPSGYRFAHQSEFELRQNLSEPNRPYADLPPPRTYVPEGVRYSIKGHKVKWMDWEFHFTSNQMRGPAIFDVRFKGKRIAYEISLQDVTLLYASQTNGAGPMALSDTGFLLGNYNVPRYELDCPSHGSILYASIYHMQRSFKVSPAACVFEADGQKPLWRHGYRGLADHHLIVRASMNLGNYDYALDFKFQLDGSIETLLSASGFLYGAFWDPDDQYLKKEKSATPFGYRISEYQLGPIHDHNYLFKIDLDIEGRNNSFQTRHWKSGPTVEAYQTQSNVTTKPGFFLFNTTRYIEYEILQNESSFLIDPLKPKQWSVVNENERNVWGNIRGYRVIPYTSSAEILQDHPLLDAWDHLNFTFAVTKHKIEEEHGTTSWYDLQHPTRAFGGVGRMLNNENARDDDLVVWMNYKFMHVPTAEDLPMTLSVPGGFLIKPDNYFDRTSVFDVPAHYDANRQPYTLEPCEVP